MQHQSTDTPGNPSVSKRGIFKLNDRSDEEPLRLLSEKDWHFWLENGYVIIPDAVPSQNLKAVKQLLWEFQEMDPVDQSPWYRSE